MSKKRRSKQQVETATVEDVSTGIPSDEVIAEGSGPAAASNGVDAMQMDDGISVARAVSAAPDEPASELDGEPRVEGDAELQAATDGPLVSESAEAPADGATLEASVSASASDRLEEIEEGEGMTDGEAAVLPTSAANMDAARLKSLVEALVFASDKPLTVQRLRQLTRVSDIPRLEQALAELATDYEQRGLILHQVSGGYQFRTRPQFSVWVQQLIAGRPVRLSRAQLETLAIVAYRQPITRPEIDDIRGVDSSATLKLLLDRALIRVLGKKEEVGRPMLYGTTKEFLDFFSLGDLRELPTLREYSELSEESRKVISDRLGVSVDGSGEGGEGGGAPPSGGDSGPMDSGPMDSGPMDSGPMDGAAMSDDSPVTDEALATADEPMVIEEMIAATEDLPVNEEMLATTEDPQVNEEMVATTEDPPVIEEMMAATEDLPVNEEMLATTEEPMVTDEAFAMGSGPMVVDEALAMADAPMVADEAFAMGSGPMVVDDVLAAAEEPNVSDEMIAMAEEPLVAADVLAMAEEPSLAGEPAE